MRSFHVTRKDLIYFCFPFLSFRTKFYLSPISLNSPLHIFPADRIHGVKGNGIKGLPFRKPIKKFNTVTSVMGVVSQIVIAVDDFNFCLALFHAQNLLFRLIYAAAKRISIGAGRTSSSQSLIELFSELFISITSFRFLLIRSGYSIE